MTVVRRETPGPELPPSLNHDLLGQFAWIVSSETGAVKRWHGRLTAANGVEPIHMDWDDRWDAILGILNHSAVLSRLFWPPYRPRCECKTCLAKLTDSDREQLLKRKVRGEFLRDLFEVPPDSPLNEAGRALRNTIEHWDMRLDDKGWAQRISVSESEGGSPLYIGPFDIKPVGPNDTERGPGAYPIRAYDPYADIVACGATRMPIEPLAREARRLKWRLNQVFGYMIKGSPIWFHEDNGSAAGVTS